MTELEEYQEWVDEVTISDFSIASAGLGLAGEAGEVIEIIKKSLREEEYYPSEEEIDKLTLELGDVLWYVAKIANLYDISLDDVVNANIEKINERIGNLREAA